MKLSILFCLVTFLTSSSFAGVNDIIGPVKEPIRKYVGSWSFSGQYRSVMKEYGFDLSQHCLQRVRYEKASGEAVYAYELSAEPCPESGVVRAPHFVFQSLKSGEVWKLHLYKGDKCLGEVGEFRGYSEEVKGMCLFDYAAKCDVELNSEGKIIDIRIN